MILTGIRSSLHTPHKSHPKTLSVTKKAEDPIKKNVKLYDFVGFFPFGAISAPLEETHPMVPFINQLFTDRFWLHYQWILLPPSSSWVYGLGCCWNSMEICRCQNQHNCFFDGLDYLLNVYIFIYTYIYIENISIYLNPFIHEIQY